MKFVGLLSSSEFSIFFLHYFCKAAKSMRTWLFSFILWVIAEDVNAVLNVLSVFKRIVVINGIKSSGKLFKDTNAYRLLPRFN